VRICVKNASGKYSTVSVPPKKHEHLVQLARGSSNTPTSRVTEVYREAANELRKTKYTGKLSIAVYEKALRKLRGSFMKERADAYDAAQLPDGIAVEA
jgi:hypothetical protein